MAALYRFDGNTPDTLLMEKVVGSIKMNNRKAAIVPMLKGSVLVSDAIP